MQQNIQTAIFITALLIVFAGGGLLIKRVGNGETAVQTVKNDIQQGLEVQDDGSSTSMPAPGFVQTQAETVSFSGENGITARANRSIIGDQEYQLDIEASLDILPQGSYYEAWLGDEELHSVGVFDHEFESSYSLVFSGDISLIGIDEITITRQNSGNDGVGDVVMTGSF